MGKATDLGSPDDLQSKFDPAVPNVARAYDFILGGKENFPADRELAARVMQLIPSVERSCRLNREFLGRVVGHLSGAGIAQFLDIGSGLPTQSNVHQIAQAANRDARIVYADHDPVVVSHARARLMGGNGVLAIEGDLRNPDDIIGQACELLDFRRPVAILMFAIIHFITDDEQPNRLVSAFKNAVVPGSCLALSHITDEQVDPDVSKSAQEVFHNASAQAVPRSYSDILRFFDGLTLLGPGLVPITEWPEHQQGIPSRTLFYGGVGVKDELT
jgi:S-adenosyl methyltransferase